MRRQSHRRRNRLLLGLVLLAVVALGALAAFVLAVPAAKLESDPQMLARLKLAPAGVSLDGVHVTAPDGSPIRVAVRGGRVVPLEKLLPGEPLTIKVTVRRAGWASWIGGKTKVVNLQVTTPTARVATDLLRPASGDIVRLQLDSPVEVVRTTGGPAGGQNLTFSAPHNAISLNIRALGPTKIGTVGVQIAARSWETLSDTETVSWFPSGTTLQALVSPQPGGEVAPTQPISLTFSEPISVLFGLTRPTFTPDIHGTWTQSGSNVLVFQPSGSGFGLGTHVVLQLPKAMAVSGSASALKALTWEVPLGSTLRLQQLLSELGYLPLSWEANGDAVSEAARDQAEAAIKPPSGQFTWRYDVPKQLKGLWAAGTYTTMTQAAVEQFEHDNGLTVDGLVGPAVWHAIIAAAVAGKTNENGYSYVLVHRSVPQNLTLWHDGKEVLHTKVNTGVPGAPTPLGTHAVFEHIPSGTMSGVNPDGSHYHDPNIPWISYFNGGEAIHGFNRGSYGFPQSVGCVETPVDVAKQIWPYTPIGTLVTITE